MRSLEHVEIMSSYLKKFKESILKKKIKRTSIYDYSKCLHVIDGPAVLALSVLGTSVRSFDKSVVF